MTAIRDGVYMPPEVTMYLTDMPFNETREIPDVVIDEISAHAGTAIGMAVIRFPKLYAENASVVLGREIRLQSEGWVYFRGAIIEGPYNIGVDSDEVWLVAADDKYLMQDRYIGQYGIGTLPATPPEDQGKEGFADVGFETIFNRDGKPNKDASNLDFNTGSSAVSWALKDILEFIFEYIDSDVCRVADFSALGAGYDRDPSHVDLRGINCVEAINLVAELAGESWGLVPGEEYSLFQRVVAGAGTERTVYLTPPQRNLTVDGADTMEAVQVTGGTSIENAVDVYQARSALIWKEHTYTNTGSDPLLTRQSTFKDKKFAARFVVDVTKYSDNNLGNNLSSGSRPKPWLQHLITRKSADGSGYITKAQIDADAALKNNERIAKPVIWLSEDGSSGNAKLCTSGVEMDCEAGAVSFEPVVGLMQDSGDEDDEVSINDWSLVGIWVTVVTVLERPVTAQSDDGDQYLPRQRYQEIKKTDLVPEYRQSVWLPNLSGNNNAVSTVAASEEKYVPVETELETAINSAIAQTPAIEAPIKVQFAFVPQVRIGDRLTFNGRVVGVTGSEVVESLTTQFTDGIATGINLRATNVVKSINPERYMEQS